MEEEYKCMICNKVIPKKKIPKEFFEKIGMQMIWHNECMRKEKVTQ
jgi:hypothetical protein